MTKSVQKLGVAGGEKNGKHNGRNACLRRDGEGRKGCQGRVGIGKEKKKKIASLQLVHVWPRICLYSKGISP